MSTLHVPFKRIFPSKDLHSYCSLWLLSLQRLTTMTRIMILVLFTTGRDMENFASMLSLFGLLGRSFRLVIFKM